MRDAQCKSRTLTNWWWYVSRVLDHQLVRVHSLL